MVVALKRLTATTAAEAATALAVVLSMIWWNSAGGGGSGGNGRARGLLLLVERTGSGFWSSVSAPSNVGIAVAVTAMAGIALAATLVYSNSGSLKSPWSRRRRKSALSPQQWKNLFDPDGKFRDGGVRFLRKVRSGGVDPRIRAEVWPFLLGVYELTSTQEERENIRNLKRKEYESLRSLCRPLVKRNNEIIEVKKNSGIVSKENEVGVNPVAHSPGSDVDGVNESVSIDRGTPEDKGSDHPTDDTASHVFNSLVEEDDNSSGITNADTSPVSTESPDSDSSGESGSMIISPPAENSCVNHPIPPPKEDLPINERSKSEVRKTEDFATWQRIILLDAVRANSDWIVYSPAQAAITDNSAREAAEAVGLKDFDHLEPCRVFHAARLVAILEAYALYDPEIGYCQGMSDLLSPIVAFMEEDHMAFWCFVGFMKKARHNFRLDEVGISRQLNIVAKIIQSKDSYLFRHLQKLQAENCFFVYRMVVVLFRRELTFEQTVCMWEVMWADQAAIRAGISKSAWGRIRLRAPPTEDLLLFAIAACVLQRRKLIIEKYSSMDEIIKECNSMAGHLDVWKLLDDAHDLVVTLHNKI